MYTLEQLRTFCLSLPEVTEDFPFDENTLAFRIYGKIFLLTDILEFSFVNLKAEPEEVIRLREEHPYVQPGYHMNKKHWISVFIRDVPGHQWIQQRIVESYLCVIQGLPKKIKEPLIPKLESVNIRIQ